MYTSTFTVGVSLSYALSGFLAAALGWRLGLALLGAGPLAAAAIGWVVLPPLPRATPRGSRWLPALGPILRNRRALLFVWAYGLHNGEVSAIRAWLVALLVFAADRAGRPNLTGYATLIATIANLCGTPLIIAANGAFLAVQALSGFGASTVTPMLLGLVLDLAGGSGHAAAWITAFAVQAAVGLVWPLGYWSARLRTRRARLSRAE